MALLDDAVPGPDRARIEHHLASCPACREDYRGLQGLCAELDALGAAIEAERPAIDVVEKIAARVRRYREGCPTGAELMAYVAGELDDVGYARLKQRMDAESLLAEEVAGLEALHGELAALGVEVSATLPEMNLLEGIMRRVAEVNSAEKTVLEQLEAELEAFGDTVAASVPEVNLVEDVMQAVKTAGRAHLKVVPLRTRPKPHTRERRAKRLPLGLWAGLAAAACLAITVSLVWGHQRARGGDPGTKLATAKPAEKAETRPTPSTSSSHGVVDVGQEKQPSIEEMFQAVRAETRRLYIDTPVEGAKTEEPPRPRAKGISLQDAIKARREALLKDVDALNRLGQWASLAPDEARALIAQGGLSTEAMVGVAQFLPPEEATPILEAAVDEHPEDPYLRYALAKNYAEDPEHSADAQEQLLAWAQLDPENSLPLYMEANLFLAQGKEDDALGSLEGAGGYGAASPYSLEAAQTQEQALAASGMAPDVARFLAATSAGSQEYTGLTQLGRQLIEYGSYYESQGDYETAEMIYDAVQDMGTQLVESAALANERLAGVDTQISALDALSGIYSLLGSEENLRIIEATYHGLIETIQGLVAFFEGFDQFFASASDEEAAAAAGQILENGDLGLLGFLGL